MGCAHMFYTHTHTRLLDIFFNWRDIKLLKALWHNDLLIATFFLGNLQKWVRDSSGWEVRIPLFFLNFILYYNFLCFNFGIRAQKILLFTPSPNLNPRSHHHFLQNPTFHHHCSKYWPLWTIWLKYRFGGFVNTTRSMIVAHILDILFNISLSDMKIPYRLVNRCLIYRTCPSSSSSPFSSFFLYFF